MRLAARLAIGLGVPFAAVVPTIPWLSRLPGTVFGMPVAVIWLFGCIPLTSACLALCWFLHDRHEPEPDAAPLRDDVP